MKTRLHTAIRLLLVSSSLFVGLSLNAAERQQHEAHVHGIANINLIAEAGEVMLELKTPAANLVGFEHQPNTKDQKAAISRALTQLTDYQHIAQFTQVCDQVEVDVDSPFEDGKHHDKHDKHHDEHAHHDKHDKHHDEHAHHDKHDKHHDEHAHHDKHDKHHDEHAHHDKHDKHHDEHAHHEHGAHEGDDTHSEFHVVYKLDCSKLKQVDSFTVILFKTFPAVEQVKVNWVVGSQQGAATVKSKSARIVIN